MPAYLDDTTRLRAPAFTVLTVPGGLVALDPSAPNWIATDDRGVRLLARFDGHTPFGQVVKDYALESGLDVTRAWLQVETFTRDASRQGFLSTDGAAAGAYLGRAAYLELDRLREFWIQLNDFCNLACEHCLVSSGPSRAQGLETARIVEAIDQAAALGVDRIFFTGGEPLARPDILDLCAHACERRRIELVILTNGTLLKGDRLAGLAELAQHAATSGGTSSPAPSQHSSELVGPHPHSQAPRGSRSAPAAGASPVPSESSSTTPGPRSPIPEESSSLAPSASFSARGAPPPLAAAPRLADSLVAAAAGARRAPRLRLQISLDGSNAAINDPIRGPGSFARIVDGVKAAVSVGLQPTLTTTILRHNLGDLEEMVRLAASLGVRNLHLLWPHRRGRVLTGPFADLPTAEEILCAVRKARAAARELGISIDNVEEFRLRLDGTPGIKNDLAGAGWNSLCLYTDGCIYPSASMAGVPELRCGDLSTQTLEAVWKDSALCRQVREATVERKPICRGCTLKFLCGGGDLEHGYWTTTSDAHGGRGSFVAHDPYCDLYKGLAADAFAELAREGRASVQARSGFDRPVVFRGMGDETLHDEAAIVRTTHSACVLSEEVLERSRLTVREFYGRAAEQPQAELCCPMRPGEDDLAHIPAEVVERFYGCGSPVTAAALGPGETMVDLGSGAGIDVFIAAKKIGPQGRAIGVDMTDEMLGVARACQPRVAAALGYDTVEFRKGYLEQIPLDDRTADVVTSNCVINLSPDKPKVFREIWRVLKDHGRAVIADVVSDRDVPPKMRADGRLWGECISGALTEEAFLAALERAGFYGVQMLKKSFWREVEGCTFYSVTVRGYKFEKKAGCTYVGQYAIYLGPQKAVIDEEGHLFPRGTPVEVCTDTASKLSHAPYALSFVIVDGPGGAREVAAGDDGSCGPGCC